MKRIENWGASLAKQFRIDAFMPVLFIQVIVCHGGKEKEKKKEET